MFGLIVAVLGLLIYLILPMPLQFIALLINSSFPDPIPYIDELIMYAAFIKKMLTVIRIYDWVCDHKIIAIIAGGLIVFALLLWIF